MRRILKTIVMMAVTVAMLFALGIHMAMDVCGQNPCPTRCDDVRENTAIGSAALGSNTTGSGNTASGFQALRNNTTGFSNTASGASALSGNTTGSNNTATGTQA